MTAIGSAAALLLALVLTWAATAKLTSGPATAEAFRALGVPGPRAAARVVPLGELAAALLLLLRPVAGAVLAGGLLAAFTVFLLITLRRGVEAPCSCFGSARSEPVSTLLVLRNAGLLVAAALAAMGAGPSGVSVEALIAVGSAALAGAVLLALAHLRRATGRLWDNTLETGPGGVS